MTTLLLRLFDALGWLWCIPQAELETEEMVNFLKKKVPIFWVMGPPKTGKSRIAEVLGTLTKYNVFNVAEKIKEVANEQGYDADVIKSFLSRKEAVSDEIVVLMIRRHILSSYKHVPGFVIDGFPIDMHQAKMCTKHFCKPNIIVYVCLLDKDVASRAPAGMKPEEAVKVYNEWIQKLNVVYINHERKTLKVTNQTSAFITCTHLVNLLNKFHGYNF